MEPYDRGKYTGRRIVCFGLWVGIIILLLTETALNLTPPISRDALIHHLAIPKLWLLYGSMYEIPWAEFSYYPMNLDILYLLPLFFNNDIIPKFIHMAFSLGTAFLVYLYLKSRTGKLWALTGFLIFLSTPIIIRLSTTAYVDLGMVFGITASVFAFVKWRDEAYQNAVWLVLSAVCMGFALGTKPNALIAWFFLNLVLVAIHSKDTGGGVKSIQYGAIFFLVALLVVSPWYIKNCLQTGNPFFPLFNGFFKNLHALKGGEDVLAATVNNNWASNIFTRREILFGENFWEVLLIPFRIFFQGKDDSAQFFDGVLSPILILALPFAFISKDDSRDKRLFLFFSIFFFFIGYFLEVIRIRYIVPILPFMAVLCVMGIKNVFTSIGNMRGSFRLYASIAFSLLLVFLIGLNFQYLWKYFRSVQPVPYILKQETREDFLKRNLGSYSAIQYINENLPDESNIFLMFLGRRAYYLDRPYRHERSFGAATLRKLVQAAQDRQTFFEAVDSLGCTHIIMRVALVNQYLENNFSGSERSLFSDRVREFWKMLYGSDGYAVYEISQPIPG